MISGSKKYHHGKSEFSIFINFNLRKNLELEEIILHEDYNSATTEHDIALLRLKEPLDLSVRLEQHVFPKVGSRSPSGPTRCTRQPACRSQASTSRVRLPGCTAGAPLRWAEISKTLSGFYLMLQWHHGDEFAENTYGNWRILDDLQINSGKRLRQSWATTSAWRRRARSMATHNPWPAGGNDHNFHVDHFDHFVLW